MTRGWHLLALLIAAASALGMGGVALLLASWRRRSALAAVLASATVFLTAFTIISGPTSDTGEAAMASAAGALVFGAALLGLGQAVDRLLGDEAEEGG